MSKDILEELFKQMPNEQPSDGFKDNLMLLIDKATIKTDRKISNLCLISIIVASIILVAIAIYISIYLFDDEIINSILSLFQIDLEIENPFDFKFVDYVYLKNFKISVYIGGMILLLLFGDYLMRSYFAKKNIKL